MRFYRHFDNIECIILWKRLVLKSEKDHPSKNKSDFFLPAFLPIYAKISKPYIDFFNDNYSVLGISLFLIQINNLDKIINLIVIAFIILWAYFFKIIYCKLYKKIKFNIKLLYKSQYYFSKLLFF